ncbi:hypothetical protein [Pedobacter sp. MW01-1-1]|uniref:hypothetical protein n=1 Tax=Pedobacter sp. MW01-1-1 TaxID=3383027 RepID=UPI003FEEDF31
MKENIENNDWMKDAPTLAEMAKRNPFIVPEGYFDANINVIQTAIYLDEIRQNQTTGFEVPENYFENLSERIETVVALAAVKPENSFTVPENYFNTLESRINERIAAVETKKEAKIIPLWRRSLVKYASAACVLLLSTFGFYYYENNFSSEAQIRSAEMANEQMLYDIDESTIIEHLEAQPSSTVQKISASDTEMENYILSNYSSNDLTQEL